VIQHWIEEPSFQRSYDDLTKQFPSLPKTLADTKKVLSKHPMLGDAIPKFRGKIRKLRLPNPDLERGKSGGFRLIYGYDSNKPDTIILIDIYSKTERADLTSTEIKAIFRRFRIVFDLPH